MSQLKTILWFVTGVSIGAIAGILLAPRPGEDIRKKLLDKTSDIQDHITGAVTGIIDKLEKDADEEIRREDRNIVPKMNKDII